MVETQINAKFFQFKLNSFAHVELSFFQSRGGVFLECSVMCRSELGQLRFWHGQEKLHELFCLNEIYFLHMLRLRICSQ